MSSGPGQNRQKTRASRLQARLKHLDGLEQQPPLGQAITSLRTRLKEGRPVDSVLIRRSFIETDTSVAPPTTRLISPRGHTLKVALLALFLAQTGNGRHRWVMPNLTATSSAELAWADLIVGGLTDGPGSASRSRSEKRAACARSALTRLSDPEISLIQLRPTGLRTGRYDRATLLEDSGPRHSGDPVRYSLPRPGPTTLALPVEFYVNGWIYVLEDSEILTYLMYRTLAGDTLGNPARITADQRRRRFGIKTSAWEQHWVLTGSGLLHLHPDPNRRSDGTLVAAAGTTPENHRMSLTDEGLKKPALDEVWKTIDERSRS